MKEELPRTLSNPLDPLRQSSSTMIHMPIGFLVQRTQRKDEDLLTA
jgi:hypothetical protein